MVSELGKVGRLDARAARDGKETDTPEQLDNGSCTSNILQRSASHWQNELRRTKVVCKPSKQVTGGRVWESIAALSSLAQKIEGPQEQTSKNMCTRFLTPARAFLFSFLLTQLILPLNTRPTSDTRLLDMLS